MWYAKLSSVPLYRVYLWFFAPILVAMAYVLPPFQAPDEVAHFYRSVQLSRGEIIPTAVSGSYRAAAGGDVDADAMSFAQHYCTTPTWICPEKARPTAADIIQTRSPDDGLRLAAFSNTVIYPPLAHLIPAVAIALARGLGLGATGWFYAGRLANVIFAIAVTVAALRLLRGCRQELPVFAIGTLPMTLTLMPTFSADVGVIACSLLLLAICVRLRGKEGKPGWTWPMLILAELYVVAAKIAYLPLAFVAPVCAWGRGDHRRPLVGALLVAAGIAGLTFAWAGVIQGYVFPISPDPRVDVAGQLAFLQAHPLGVAGVIATSMVREIPNSFATLVGWKLSGNSVMLPFPLLAVSAVSLVVALVVGGSGELRGKRRLVVGLLVLASAASTFLLLYIQNSRVGGAHVDAYQGRYLLPVLPFVTLLIPPLDPGGVARGPALRVLVVGCSCCVAVALLLFLALRSW